MYMSHHHTYVYITSSGSRFLGLRDAGATGARPEEHLREHLREHLSEHRREHQADPCVTSSDSCVTSSHVFVTEHARLYTLAAW